MDPGSSWRAYSAFSLSELLSGGQGATNANLQDQPVL